MDPSHNMTVQIILKGRVVRKRSGQLLVSRVVYSTQDVFIRNLNRKVSFIDGANYIFPSLEMLNILSGIISTSSSFNIPKFLFCLQSPVRFLLDNASATVRRGFKTLMEDDSLLFMNELCQDLASAQRQRENAKDYVSRKFVDALFYLKNRFKIKGRLLVSDEHDPLLSNTAGLGLSIVTVEELIKEKAETGLEAVAGLVQAREEVVKLRSKAIGAVSTGDDEDSSFRYSNHLSSAEVQQGLSDGRLFVGKLFVSKHDSTLADVEVAVGERGVGVARVEVYKVVGRRDMNRGMDGDEVVLEMCPRESWKGVSDEKLMVTLPSSLNENDEEEIDEMDDLTKFISTTGSADCVTPNVKVVAIRQRHASLECVATVPLRRPKTDASFSSSSSSSLSPSSSSSFVSEREEFVLAIPHDRRMPKIRIRTRQWSLFQGQVILN